VDRGVCLLVIDSALSGLGRSGRRLTVELDQLLPCWKTAPEWVVWVTPKGVETWGAAADAVVVPAL